MIGISTALNVKNHTKKNKQTQEQHNKMIERGTNGFHELFALKFTFNSIPQCKRFAFFFFRQTIVSIL